ncbi:hypothetical protein HanOQP8_Chr16g0616381 [Helianthus annuus]|nr:hypothetical protein HanOQP8_Chr16g0616381 [Helianthus annuus]
MSSSEGSNIYDDVDPMELSSDDDYVPEVQVILSDSDSTSDSDMDDFQPFALLGEIIDDDVLAIPPIFNDVVIIGHPEGEHVVEVIPWDVLPLAIVPFIDDLDEEDDAVVPVIPVEHLDDELGDGDVHDLVILEVPAPVVPIFIISSDSDTDSDASTYASVTSSALQGHVDFGDDMMPAEPAIPVPIPVPAPDASPEHVRLIHFAPIIPPTDHTDEAGPSGHAHIPPSVEPLTAPYPPPHVMPLTDPYHPLHFPAATTELRARVLTLEHQIDFVIRRVSELEDELTHLIGLGLQAPPPPPGSPPLPPLPPQMPPVDIPPVDLPTRVLALEQQSVFLHRLVLDLEGRVSDVHRLLFPIPPPVFPPP